MKKIQLLKASVIIVSLLVALLAQYTENKRSEKIQQAYKALSEKNLTALN